MAVVEHGIAPEQDAAVPELRPLALLLGEMRRDLGTLFFRERPDDRPHGKSKRRDAMNDR